MTKLTLDDIADLRAYEREREGFRKEVIALKKRRRVAVGPHVTFLFENRDTIRFQIQEMARVEKILSDDGIQSELDTYNPLIPEPGTLCATMFIELTDDEQLREWLPKLVGVERAPELRLRDGTVVAATPDEAHDAQLTRDTITASVHYLRFELEPGAVEAFAAGPVQLAVAHPSYAFATELDEPTRHELLGDLQGR
ncbi:MAG: DUF3501 family protein [Acidimicrobiia bacterium]|nr:DUF3501 family protein [Acidimicrobiia bacterium]